MKARGEIALLAIGLGIVILLALAGSQREVALSTYSSYDTGPDGYRALYEVIRREGVSVHRFEDDLGRLHARSGTLLVSSSDPERFASRLSGSLDRNDAAALTQFVRGGGRLVCLGDALQFAGASAVAPPKTASIDAASFAQPAEDDAFTAGVRRVDARFTAAFPSALPRGARTLLAVRGRPVAIAFPVGRGEVIAVTQPGIFSNAVLARDQNARFAFNALTGAGPLLFDERVHGYARGASMWSVLPKSVRAAVWTTLAILLLAVVGGMFRSAPPLALEPPRSRDSSAYVASMAALLRRARAGSAAIERFAQDALRLARMRPSLARSGAVAAQLAELDALQDLSHPGDAALLAAAQLNVQLRKELA
ncbi:MAG TPA: DUF4350 domain-containing protein [Candidatus Tyrphobacter sp.]